jgi:hypothetical protein
MEVFREVKKTLKTRLTDDPSISHSSSSIGFPVIQHPHLAYEQKNVYPHLRLRDGLISG